MKKKQINIAIAEASGAIWHDVPMRQFYVDCEREELWPKRLLSFTSYDFEHPRCAPLPFPDPEGNAEVIPDYTEDLNAIHKAVKLLKMSWEMRLLYADNIEYILSDYDHGKSVNRSYCIEASAKIRAEALVRTLDKWTT